MEPRQGLLHRALDIETHICNCIAMSSVVFEADNTWSEASVDGAAVLPCAGCRRTWEAAKLAWCIVLYTYTRLLHIDTRWPYMPGFQV